MKTKHLQTKQFHSMRRIAGSPAAPNPSAPAAGRALSVARQPLDLDRSSSHARLDNVEPAHVTLSGDLSGDYVVEDERPDGRIVLRPDLSVKAMLARHGERKLTPEEFEQHFGQLPTDDEG
jgi:hypothetical protein